jgi:hypothetical protein
VDLRCTSDAAAAAGARGGGSQHGRAAVGHSEADVQWGIAEDLLPHPWPQEDKTNVGWTHSGQRSASYSGVWQPRRTSGQDTSGEH